MTVVGGLKSVVVALPHRGRLSLLCDPDLLGFSPTALFSKIKGKPEFDPETAPGATGDVISHLAATRQIKYEGGEVEVEVLQNPSHLEVGRLLRKTLVFELTLLCRPPTLWLWALLERSRCLC